MNNLKKHCIGYRMAWKHGCRPTRWNCACGVNFLVYLSILFSRARDYQKGLRFFFIPVGPLSKLGGIIARQTFSATFWVHKISPANCIDIVVVLTLPLPARGIKSSVIISIWKIATGLRDFGSPLSPRIEEEKLYIIDCFRIGSFVGIIFVPCLKRRKKKKKKEEKVYSQHWPWSVSCK